MEYRIRGSGKNSDYYGNCEVCGKYCTIVYTQQQKNRLTVNGWINHAYGHVKCLRTGPWEHCPVEHREIIL